MRTRNQLDLRLFTDNEAVTWCRDDARRAAPVEQSLEELLCSDAVLSAGRIRVLGFPSNAPLICGLWQRMPENAIGHPTLPIISAEVLIGTPGVCSPSGHHEDPDVVFRQMQELQAIPASLGGMRPLTGYDYISYKLVESLQKGELPDIRDIAWHPAWPAVSFVLEAMRPLPKQQGKKLRCVDNPEWMDLPAYAAAVKVLGYIMDPRWFVDWQHPDRLSKLRMYMGVTPKHIRNAWHETSGTGLRDVRARAVLDAWTNGERRTPKYDINKFLWKGVAATEDVLALRASGMYLNFVRNVWLNNMRQDNRVLFVPEYYFPSKKDVEAYDAHQLLWEIDYGDL